MDVTEKSKNLIDEILSMWNRDAVIDNADIGNEILKIPKIHAKYLRILTENRLASKRQELKYEEMRGIRFSYFSGHFDKETLEKYGWEQWDVHISTKTGIERYLESDPVLLKILQRKACHDQIVSTCEFILKEISTRSWQLKTYVDWRKFESGLLA
jgi:hypothetical protein